EVEVQQKRSMKQDGSPTPPLRVAGEFAVADGEVGVAADKYFGFRISDFGFERSAATSQQGFQRRAVALHHEPVRARDRLQRQVGIHSEDQRVIQAAGALENRAAAAAATQDRDAKFLARCDVYLARDAIRVADGDEVLLRFPETEHFRAVAGVAPVEQRLVAGEVFLRRRKWQVEVFHS